MQEEIKVTTKQRGPFRTLVLLNGRREGAVEKVNVYGRTYMYRSSRTGRRNYDTRKEAIAATVAAITG